MELRHLEVFVAVAEELSFTRASSRLHLVQSGVSSAVKALERDLGAALFDRDRHRVKLTDAGRVLLPEARATLAAAQAARDAVSQAQGGLRGTVTVGTMLSTGPLDLPGLLGRFHRAHPGVTVRLRLAASGSAGLAREVLAGSLDLALVSLPGPAPAGLNLRPVTEEPLVAVGQPGHPLAARPATLAQLAAEPFIDFPPGWGNRAVADRAFAAAGLDREVPFEAADFTAVIDLVRGGLGIALLPASVAAGQGADLAVIEISDHTFRWVVSVAVPAGRRISAAARALLAQLPGAQSPGAQSPGAQPPGSPIAGSPTAREPNRPGAQPPGSADPVGFADRRGR
jgi:DNA-binding transcriptional LysR family regulator